MKMDECEIIILFHNILKIAMNGWLFLKSVLNSQTAKFFFFTLKIKIVN